ncbi:hypothetical protein AB0C76_20755 [Kitasatospora sp. NPDC048722]|uniref:hypothetical protein n=1 Tax=Kitasatospora sp. NPDC048722 TaxID=3155639 RepID=UPI0033E7F7E9
MSSAPQDLGSAAAVGGVSPEPRARLVWLLPIGWFALTVFLGFGRRIAGPPWAEVTVRLVAVGMVVWLLRLWVSRRRMGTAQSMPPGSALTTWGVFVGLVAFRVFLDQAGVGSGIGWFGAVLSALLLLMSLGWWED